jgi:hypothetical protein
MIPSPDACLPSEWHYLVSLLVHQGWPVPMDVSAISMERALHLAKANDLLLAVGNALKLTQEGGLFPSIYEVSYQRAKSLEESTHQLISEVLAACERAGLALLTIKSFLPFSYADSNIDLVAVETAQIGAYRNVLHELGYKRWFSLADLREPYKRMYRASDRGKNQTYPMLHLHRAISWNGVEYVNLATVWRRHRLMDVGAIQVPVPSFEDEVLIMAAHAIFENKYITLKELVYLQWLAEHQLDWGYVVRSAESLFWREALDIFLSTALVLAKALNLVIKVEIDLPSPQSAPRLFLPYLLPVRQTFAVSWEKLRRDLASGRWRTLPRQLFSYFFVDVVWMYRKARRKCRAITETR